MRNAKSSRPKTEQPRSGRSTNQTPAKASQPVHKPTSADLERKNRAIRTLTPPELIDEIRALLSELRETDGNCINPEFFPAATLLEAGDEDDDRPQSVQENDFDYDLRVLELKRFDWRRVSLEPGKEFHEWAAEQTRTGLFMDINESFYTAVLFGQGRRVNFPKRGPGDVDVEIRVEYDEALISLEDLTKTQLRWMLGTLRLVIHRARKLAAKEEDDKSRNELRKKSQAAGLEKAFGPGKGNSALR